MGPDEVSLFPGSVGKPYEGVEVQIGDDDHQGVSSGGTGMLRARTRIMVSAYEDNSSATKCCFQGGSFSPIDLTYINEFGDTFCRAERRTS